MGTVTWSSFRKRCYGDAGRNDSVECTSHMGDLESVDPIVLLVPNFSM